MHPSEIRDTEHKLDEIENEIAEIDIAEIEHDFDELDRGLEKGGDLELQPKEFITSELKG